MVVHMVVVRSAGTHSWIPVKRAISAHRLNPHLALPATPPPAHVQRVTTVAQPTAKSITIEMIPVVVVVVVVVGHLCAAMEPSRAESSAMTQISAANRILTAPDLIQVIAAATVVGP
jgi:hypothetical protein